MRQPYLLFLFTIFPLFLFTVNAIEIQVTKGNFSYNNDFKLNARYFI